MSHLLTAVSNLPASNWFNQVIQYRLSSRSSLVIEPPSLTQQDVGKLFHRPQMLVLMGIVLLCYCYLVCFPLLLPMQPANGSKAGTYSSPKAFEAKMIEYNRIELPLAAANSRRSPKLIIWVAQHGEFG